MPQPIIKHAVIGETVPLYQQFPPDIVIVPMRKHTAIRIKRVVAIVVRGRPVVAVGTDIVDRSPVAVASSGQEDPVCVSSCLSHRAKRILAEADGTFLSFLNDRRNCL